MPASRDRLRWMSDGALIGAIHGATAPLPALLLLDVSPWYAGCASAVGTCSGAAIGLFCAAELAHIERDRWKRVAERFGWPLFALWGACVAVGGALLVEWIAPLFRREFSGYPLLRMCLVGLLTVSAGGITGGVQGLWLPLVYLGHPSRDRELLPVLFLSPLAAPASGALSMGIVFLTILALLHALSP